MRSVILRVAAAVMFAAAAAGAQERDDAARPEQPRPEALKLDEYGNLRHCDWSARLDNFAIELQNNPAARGFVVSYNAPDRHSYAPRQLKVARHYMVEARGIDASRLVMIEAGVREDLEEGQTELWVVPEGAEPPAAPPAVDRYGPNFSGKFDTFTADPNVYQEVYEMSVPDSFVSRSEFAAKLRQQPESVGYVVIRTPPGNVPGGWQRYARRDEQLLREFKVDASRIRTLDGGQAAGGLVEVELWVLPSWAPPPASVAEKLEPAFNSAAVLHTFDANGLGDEDTSRWMIENLAAFLREHPRATALLVAREPPPDEQIEWDDANVADPGASAGEVTAEAPAEAPEETAPAEPEEKELTMRELAEEWKKQLAEKHGVEAPRVSVVVGRPVRWPAGRLNIWVVPEKGRRPDTQARDADEAKQEQLHGVAAEAGAAATPR